jgi:hypothetical protein
MSDDDLDRNLDTIRRRLDAMDAAMTNALSDDPAPSALPVASSPQSYKELTAFNDRLRDANHWNEVDLDAALTPELAAKLEEWRSLQRIPWSNADIAAVGLAGMVGGTCIWFDTEMDRILRQWLNPLNKTRLMQAFEKAGKQLPIDYMGPGFGGHAHRVKSAGHDLARPFTALRQIMDGQFEGIRWSFGQRESVNVTFEPEWSGRTCPTRTRLARRGRRRGAADRRRISDIAARGRPDPADVSHRARRLTARVIAWQLGPPGREIDPMVVKGPRAATIRHPGRTPPPRPAARRTTTDGAA